MVTDIVIFLVMKLITHPNLRLIAMSAINAASDLKAEIETDYAPAEDDGFVDNTEERELSGHSSCYATYNKPIYDCS